MATFMEKSRVDDLSKLRDSVDLVKVAKVAESVGLDSRARAACLALSSDKTLFGPLQCSGFSGDLGFDSRRLCAVHNFVVVSKYADSIHTSTLCKLLEGLVYSQDELEALLVEVIAQPQSALSGALIDEVAGIVRFRPHSLRNQQWAEDVYRSL